MEVTHRLTVPPEMEGERLDRYLSVALPEMSRSRIQQLIRGGFVFLGGAEARPSARLKGNEEIAVSIPPPRTLDLVPEDRTLAVLFEDDHLMVVEKPAGMVVHPSPGHDTGTLVHSLLSRAGRLSGIGGVERPGIVHRLDRDTSGIIVVAKDDASHAGLSSQLASHRMSRRYHGIVWGRPAGTEGEIRTRVGRHPVHRKKMAVFPEVAPASDRAAAPGKTGGVLRGTGVGRIAVTWYRVLASFGKFSLLEFRLKTGRTHQIRLHCAHLACPIVGDDVYGRPRKILLGRGKEENTVAVSRYLLHAFHLGFVHPRTGEWLEFTVPDPPEFEEFRDAVQGASPPEGETSRPGGTGR
ncbi:MAG TPA: RluA family pseudouridine synthase [Candidatus Deferrimicrobiaceae bacterium]|nr:RluA family pseudouridine synthase [Candidatus Deferrimicrobiaceae bacterium]